ncbi:MAG: ribonuclease N [Alphaproteobacteria bacterium]|nr:ribonuclease N [Alphaproteobacteria bacterium]
MSALPAGRRGALALLLALVVVVLPLPGHGFDDASLRDFGRRVGLRDTDGFAATVLSLETTGRLPLRYLRKDEAARLGWRPGVDLCRLAPGRAIGGDVFSNREGRLPKAPGRRYYEADLDYACGRREANRLVFSNDGLFFVTTDHYRSFHRVPR